MPVYSMKNRTSFAFSAENPTGSRNGGTHGGDCEKLNACITIEPHKTVTLCDTDGEGMITHIWFTGYVGHSFIMRIYWDNEEFPSVEAPISAHILPFAERSNSFMAFSSLSPPRET